MLKSVVLHKIEIPVFPPKSTGKIWPFQASYIHDKVGKHGATPCWQECDLHLAAVPLLLIAGYLTCLSLSGPCMRNPYSVEEILIQMLVPSFLISNTFCMHHFTTISCRKKNCLSEGMNFYIAWKHCIQFPQTIYYQYCHSTNGYQQNQHSDNTTYHVRYRQRSLLPGVQYQLLICLKVGLHVFKWIINLALQYCF